MTHAFVYLAGYVRLVKTLTPGLVTLASAFKHDDPRVRSFEFSCKRQAGDAAADDAQIAVEAVEVRLVEVDDHGSTGFCA
jgi:hypothetical protein